MAAAGEAVAIGMEAEAWLSLQRGWISEKAFAEIQDFLRRFYSPITISKDVYPSLLQNLRQDKKNRGGELLFSLIEGPGACQVDVSVSEEEVLRALIGVSS